MNDIVTLVSSYRELKRQRDEVDTKMSDIKDSLQSLVETTGNWKDDDGYVRLTQPSTSVSFDSHGVDTLVTAWLKSDDAIMNSCGQMLAGLRKESTRQPYLTIK
jgi:hypothetical protein